MNGKLQTKEFRKEKGCQNWEGTFSPISMSSDR